MASFYEEQDTTKILQVVVEVVVVVMLLTMNCPLRNGCTEESGVIWNLAKRNMSMINVLGQLPGHEHYFIQPPGSTQFATLTLLPFPLVPPLQRL